MTTTTVDKPLPRKTPAVPGARSLKTLCQGTSAVVFVLAFATLLVLVLGMTGGHFSYSMDDPYIHLALAERISHGHYGINMSEITAPSSSVIWPFLMLVGANTPIHPFMPLIANFCFGLMAALLMGKIIGSLDWKGRVVLPAVISGVLVFVANLPALSFTGLEHVLQVLISVVAVFAILRILDKGQAPLWSLALVALAPAVRYECFTLVLAVGAALLGRKRFRAAVALGAASLVLPIVFSGALLARGLPPLPNSVLAKTRTSLPLDRWLGLPAAPPAAQLPSPPPQGAHARFEATLIDISRGSLYNIVHWFMRFLVLYLAYRAIRAKDWPERWVFAGASVAVELHLKGGQMGYFFRYEDYIIIFAVLLITVLSVPAICRHRTVYGLFLLVAVHPYLIATAATPIACRNTYDQQYQLHRFVKDYYQRSVAINDLGWMSFEAPPQVYVVDIWGLASYEALRHPAQEAWWLDSVTRRHNAGLAIVYALREVPPSWTHVATMRTAGPNVAPAWNHVEFYSTGVGDVDTITHDLRAFQRTLPSGVTLEFSRIQPAS